jgi:GTPase SAR1 family protein
MDWHLVAYACPFRWVKELRLMTGSDIVIAICGNKLDLAKHRTVPKEEAEQYASSSQYRATNVVCGSRSIYVSSALRRVY